MGHNFAKKIGANFWNIARMHNSTDYAIFLEKSLEPFLEKCKNLIFCQFFTVFGQNDESGVKNKKAAWIAFLVLN